MSHKIKLRATLIGFTAVLMWATLALLTKLSGSVPPFQLMAMSFTVASSIGLALWIKKGNNFLRVFRLPKKVWGLGIFGLFGYHCFYFIALKNAPAVEASLVAYLWPLFIVLFSALLPNEKLQWFHVVGAIAGFLGAGLLVTAGNSVSFEAQYSLGYFSALMCAFTWSSYSVLSRCFSSVSTDAVAGFCVVTAVLAWFCHWLFEPTVMPVKAEWLAIVCLGLGPVGLAFFTWDYGVKYGNIKALGSLSYLSPLLSTLLLIICGFSEASWKLGVACLLIVGGATLASGDLLSKPAE